MVLYVDGIVTTKGINANFGDCRQYTGKFIFGQDGDFTTGKNLGMEQDTVAVYDRAFNASEIIPGRRFVDGDHANLYALWSDSSGSDSTGNNNVATVSVPSTSDGIVEILTLKQESEQWDTKASIAMRMHIFWVCFAMSFTFVVHLAFLGVAHLFGYSTMQIQGGYRFPHIEIKVFLAMSIGMLDISIGVLCARNSAMGWKVVALTQIVLIGVFVSWLFKLSYAFLKVSLWKPLANVTRRSPRSHDHLLGEHSSSTMGGYLSSAEIMKFARHMGMTKREGRALFRELDIDGNGILDYHEFCGLFSNERAPLAMQRALNINGRMPTEKVLWQSSTPLEGAAAFMFGARCESGKWIPKDDDKDINDAYGLLFNKFTPKHVSYYPASVVRFLCFALIVNALAPWGYVQVIVLCIFELFTFVSVIFFAPYVLLAETRSECTSFLFRFLTQIIALLGFLGAFPVATTSFFMVNSQLFAIVQNIITQVLPIVVVIIEIVSKLFCPSEEPNTKNAGDAIDSEAYSLPWNDVKLDSKPFAWGATSGAALYSGTYLGAHEIVAKRFTIGGSSFPEGKLRTKAEAAAALEVARLADLAHPCLVKIFGTTPYSESGADCGKKGRNRLKKKKKKSNMGDLDSIEAGAASDTSGGPPGLFVVMEFCSGGTLAAQYYDDAFTKKEFVRIVTELMSALCFLHEHGVVHRDLRPEHVLFNNPTQKSVRLSGLLGHVRLGNHSDIFNGHGKGNIPDEPCKVAQDGGISVAIDGCPPNSSFILGHPAYSGPECFVDDEELKKVNHSAADVYALGIMLWQLWFKRPPHENKAVHEIITSTMTRLRPCIIPGKDGIPLKHPAPPKPLAKIFKACWAQKPLERPPMAEVAMLFEKEVGPAVLELAGDITTGSALAARRAQMKAAAESRPKGKHRQKNGGKCDKSGNVFAHFSPDEAAELRLHFQKALPGTHSGATDGSSGGLRKKDFKQLVKQLVISRSAHIYSEATLELPRGSRHGMSFVGQGNSTNVDISGPSDADLDVAFAIADADANGIVDEDEFMVLCSLIKAGKVHGLSGGSSRFFGVPMWGKVQGTGSKLDAFRVALTTTAASEGMHQGNSSDGDSQAAVRRAAEKDAAAWQADVNVLRSKFREACALAVQPGHEKSADGNDMKCNDACARESLYLSGTCIVAPKLGKEEFMKLARKLAQERHVSQPSDLDLHAAFDLADMNTTISVNEEQFVNLFNLVARGRINGLSGGNGTHGNKIVGLLGNGGGATQSQPTNTAQIARIEASVGGGLFKLTPEEDHALRSAFQAACQQPAAGGGRANANVTLRKYAFMTLVKKLMQEGQPDIPMPSHEDLLAAFEVADADKSGSVDEVEFIKLYMLIKAGAVRGLCSSNTSSWSARLIGSGSKECAHVAQRSKVKTSIAAALCVASAQEVEALREAFRAACPESSPGALSREYFIALVVRLMKESGESMLPSDTDLYTAFFMADADKNGSIDEEEFVNLYALVKAGAVHGLGCSAGKEGGWSNKLNDAAHQREVRASIAALLPLPEVPVPAEEAASLLALRGTKTTHNALFTMLVKRGKTVALIAEYRRRISLPQIGNNRRNVQLIEDLPEPANLSRAFRVGGATAAAVYMDPMEGGCSLLDVKTVMEEQAGARSNHNNQKQPLGMSPLPVIWRGPVLSELQLAQASSCGCTAVVLSWRLLGPERAVNLIEVAPAYGLEVISEVLDKDEANALADLCNKLPKEAKVKLVLVGEGLSIDATCELYFNLPPHTAKIAPVPVFRDEHSGYVDKTKLTEASDKLQKAGFNALWASEVICANGAKDIYPVIRAIKVGTRNCECFVSNDLGI